MSENPLIMSNIKEVSCPLCSFKASDLKKHMFDAHKCSSQSVFSFKHLGIKKVTIKRPKLKTKSDESINDRFIKQFGLKKAKLCLPKLSQATLAKYVANLNCPLCHFKAPDLTKHMFDVHKCSRQSVFSIKHLGIKPINTKPRKIPNSLKKPKRRYECRHCGQPFDSSGQRNQHEKSEHTSILPPSEFDYHEIKEQDLVGSWSDESKLNFQWLNSVELENKEENFVIPSLYICDLCPQLILNSQSSLLEHMNKH